MPTQAQIDANRENAQFSTGPRTAEGKARSAANGLRHGLSGSFALLPHESRQDFEELRDGLIRKFQPRDTHEQYLVDQMIQAAWRGARIERLECRAFVTSLDCPFPSPDADPDDKILYTMKGGASFLTHLQRYRAAAERAYYKAHKTLMDGRAAEKQDALADQRIESGAARQQAASQKQADADMIRAIDEFVYAPIPEMQDEPNFCLPPCPAASKPSAPAPKGPTCQAA